MNRNVIISFFVLLAGLLSCVVPPGVTPTAVVVPQVIVVPEEPVQPLPTQPLPTQPVATFTLIPTDTPVGTATTEPTATLSGPYVTLLKNANCRNGPGSNKDVVTSYLKGQILKIIGRNPDFNNTWWLIEMPTGGKCWVSLSTGQATGPFDDIPIVP